MKTSKNTKNTKNTNVADDQSLVTIQKADMKGYTIPAPPKDFDFGCETKTPRYSFPS